MSAAPPKEKSMMDKLSEGISSAFNTAGTEANKAKLQTEIAMKQHQIKGIKQEFGVAAWDLMARDDTAGLQALFKQRQATAQNVIGDLGKLQRQLADLGGPKPTHVVSVTVPAGPTLCRNQFLGASLHPTHWLISTQLSTEYQ
mmetsp:Transcript_10859/g.29610  ORF Transcript_10859/g.29610 Transcript_10859/m.29610 type:complete len:143 (+) Transcript_10859:89-517(+)